MSHSLLSARTRGLVRRPAYALLWLLSGPGAAQSLVNTGTLSLTGGATLYVPGPLTNAAGATLTTDGSTLRVEGTLTTAGTLSLGSGLVEVGGDVNSSGSLSGGTGTLLLHGITAQHLSLAPGTTLHQLILNNTGTARPAVTVATDVTVTGQLLLTSGLVRTAPTATIRLPDGGTVAGESAGHYVQGHLQVTRTAVTGPVDFGLGLQLDGTGQALGPVTVTRTAGLQTAGSSYGTSLSGTAKGIDRIWTVVPAQQPTAAVPLTLSWVADDDNGNTFTPASIWRAASSAGPWVAVGAANAAALRSISGSTPTLGAFTVSGAANPLPVELVAFTAERVGADALLRWTTASEKNNAYFAVESSVDGRTFQHLAKLAGQGNSAQNTSYAFTDPNLARYTAEVVYYRLHQVDADGTGTYSPVRIVSVPLAAGLFVQAYPNPFATDVSLSIRTAEAGPAFIDLFDATGRVLLHQQQSLPKGITTLPLPAAQELPAGVYLLHVVQAGQTQTVRVIHR